MMAVILAGGKGTRLQPFTITIPKPLLPLGDVPIIEVVLRQLAGAGISKVTITLGHMAHLFSASLGNGSQFGLTLDYYIEAEPLGTAGSLKRIKNLPEDFLVMNGDLLTTFDYQDFFKAHIKSRAWGTIALHQRFVKIDYGVIRPTKNHLLGEYIEKPTIPYYVSMGINMLSRKCLNFIPASGKFDMPQLMTAMKKAGKKVGCYETDCYWQDIGRLDDYQQAHEDFVHHPDRFIPTKI